MSAKTLPSLHRCVPSVATCWLAAFALTVVLANSGWGYGQSITVPNGSFESPATLFVNVHVDEWEKVPKPDWYDETDVFLWDQLIGTFKNPAPGAADHLENIDGTQAIWIFAVPEVELFQDFESMDWNDTSPTHAFDATYQIGKAYQLTVSILGGGGGMLEGVPLEISLYYRSDDGQPRTVAATTIVHSSEAFPSRNWFTDFSVKVPTVESGHAWVGENIGVRIRSTVTLDQQGGYWDVDNVHLSESPVVPLFLTSSIVGSDLRVGWSSTIGFQYQVEISENLQTWAAYETPLPGTGGELFALVPAKGVPPSFVRVQATPSP